MMDVGRDDHAAGSNFVAYQFRRDALARRHVSHLVGRQALTGKVHLRNIAVAAGCGLRAALRDPLRPRLCYLAYTGVQQSKSYYVTIPELRSMGTAAYAKRLPVAGNVVPGSIKRRGTHMDFTLLEQETPGGPPVPKSPDGKPWMVNVEYT